MEREKTGALLVAFSAVCFGFLSIFAKLSYLAGANLVTMLAVRFSLAAVIIWTVIRLARLPYAASRRDVPKLTQDLPPDQRFVKEGAIWSSAS